MIQQGLQKLLERQDLTRAEMAAAMTEVADGGATPAQVGAFLVALRMKGETVDEIAGAAAVIRARVDPVRVARDVFVDTCGTGGDGRNTFNISTTAAFVVAGAGVTVAKHGNRDRARAHSGQAGRPCVRRVRSRLREGHPDPRDRRTSSLSRRRSSSSAPTWTSCSAS